LPAHSHDAVMRALSKDPAQRPSDAGALLREYLGPDGAPREEIMLSLAPHAASQPARDAAHGPSELQTTAERLPRRGETSGTPWTAVTIALVLVAAMAMVAVLRHRASLHTQTREDVERAITADLDATEGKRTRAARRHTAGDRGGASGATDELSALAARADRLQAIGDPKETAVADGTNANDELAKARAAIEAGDLVGAAALLAAAGHKPAADSTAIAGLSAHLSEALERRAKQLSAARDCEALSTLAEQLRSASISAPAALATGLDSCQNPQPSPADAGSAPSSAELKSP
jgi:hypothetical protein